MRFWARYAFRIFDLDFLWIQPTNFDIVSPVASSDTKERSYEVTMVPWILGTKFERGQGFMLHGDFWSDFRNARCPTSVFELGFIQQRIGHIRGLRPDGFYNAP